MKGPWDRTQPYPRSAHQFHGWFRSEDLCRWYLTQLRWPDGVRCPRCSGRRIYSRAHRPYRCGGCGIDFTLTAGTLLADTRKPLRMWFKAIWFVAEDPGAGALGLQRKLGLPNYPTAWKWMRKLRRAMGSLKPDPLTDWIFVREVPIRMPGPARASAGEPGEISTLIIAQFDHTLRHMKAARVAPVRDRSGAAFGSAIQAAVAPKVWVNTGGLLRAEELRALGYIPGGVPPRAPQALGDFVSELQAWVSKACRRHLAPADVDLRLNEFAFRWSHRRARKPGSAFHLLLRRASLPADA